MLHERYRTAGRRRGLRALQQRLYAATTSVPLSDLYEVVWQAVSPLYVLDDLSGTSSAAGARVASVTSSAAGAGIGPSASAPARTAAAGGGVAVAAAVLALLLAAMDATVMGTVLPSVLSDIDVGGGSGGGYAWLVSGFMLAQVAGTPLAGLPIPFP